jgi:CheY-like chemotaxis protein
MAENVSRCVLIVDDDEDIRDIVGEVLKDEGYRVSAVANGAEALAWLRAGNSICVILLDLMMPVMDGRQFRSEQLRDASIAEVPVIVLTADATVSDAESSIDVAEVLRKPVCVDDLLAAVARFCRSPGGGEQRPD